MGPTRWLYSSKGQKSGLRHRLGPMSRCAFWFGFMAGVKKCQCPMAVAWWEENADDAAPRPAEHQAEQQPDQPADPQAGVGAAAGVHEGPRPSRAVQKNTPVSNSRK